MISRIPGKAFLLMAIALWVPVAWLGGNHRADVLELLQALASAHHERLQLQTTIDALESDRQNLTLSLEIAEARVESLQKKLDGNLTQSMDDMAQLALYRRIEGLESDEQGVWVEEIRRVSSRRDVLSITLVQARGRDRAIGSIGVTLYSTEYGDGLRWTLTDNDKGVLKEVAMPKSLIPGEQVKEQLVSALSDDVVKVASYDLRFFQTLLVKVESITTINPDYVEIWIVPEGRQAKPHLQRFRWAEIDIGR